LRTMGMMPVGYAPSIEALASGAVDVRPLLGEAHTLSDFHIAAAGVERRRAEDPHRAGTGAGPIRPLWSNFGAVAPELRLRARTLEPGSLR
jgi:hypothetical protein